MNFNNNNIALVLWLAVQLGMAFGFQTTNCNQNQLEIKMTDTLKCNKANWKDFTDRFGSNNPLSKDNPIGCDFIDKEISCFYANVGTCFTDEIRNDVATLFEYSYSKSEYISCKRLDGARKDKAEIKAQTLIYKYAQYIKSDPDFLESIIRPDLNCQQKRFIESFDESLECLKTQVLPSAGALSQAFNLAIYGQKTSMPICEMVTQTLDCFNTNQCMTKQESDFILNMIATFYNMAMEQVVYFVDTVGITNLIKLSVDENEFAELETQWSSNFGTSLSVFIDNIVTMITDDFQVNKQGYMCLLYHL